MDKSLKSLVNSLNKQYGENVLRLGGEFRAKEKISTGSLLLDFLFGGGIPRGKIVEFYGPKSAGKTLLAMIIADQQLKQFSRSVLWLDLEVSWDALWAGQHIEDLNRVLVCRPTTAEMAIDVVRKALEAPSPPGLVVVDSVAALSSYREQERSMDDEFRVGITAALMSTAMRLWTRPADEADCSIILINQVRDNIGGYYAQKEKTPGGRAKDFFASLIVNVRGGEVKRVGDEPLGQEIHVRVTKSKIWGCLPQSTGTLFFYWPCHLPQHRCEKCERYCPTKNGYFDRSMEALVLGTQLGVIQRRGPYYEYGGKRAQGREQFLQMLTKEDIESIYRDCLKVTNERA